MPRTGSIQLARIFGIRIGVDTSWFIVLFLFIFLLSGSFKDALGGSSGTTAYVAAVGSALSFFASIVLHELGHAMAARREGIEITGIDLWFFGGVAKMSKETESPGAEFRVAIAGPIVTALILAAAVGASVAVAGSWHAFREGASLDQGADVAPVALLLSFLATMNLFLLVFNLIPAFPLDGGRIARAIAWRLTGDRVRATRIAATLGQGFSYVLMGLGIYLILSGNFINGIWLIVLGSIMGSAARGAVGATVLSERLGEVTVGDIMEREPVSVPADIEVYRAQDEYFMRYRYPGFPVVDAAGRFVGTVSQERVDGAVSAGATTQSVRDVMDPDPGDRSVGEDAPLESLLGSESLQTWGTLMAVDPDGILRGIVTVDQVRRALHSVVLDGQA
jgi:Zn-dependent protease